MREETSAPGARRLPIPTAEQAGKLPLDTAASLDAVLSPDTAASLGRDIAQRVLQLRDEDLHGREQLTRIIIHSLLSLPDEGLAELVREPVGLGNPRWDALLQGLVAWRCQTADPRIQTPAWTSAAHLDEAWAPFGGSIRDDGWYTLSVLATPAALLHRGVVLDQRNLKEL